MPGHRNTVGINHNSVYASLRQWGGRPLTVPPSCEDVMLSLLDALDRELLSILNQAHAPWLDQIMIWISGRWTWLPFYALLLAGLTYHYRVRVVPVLLVVTLMVIGADQTASGLIKPAVARLRPCHDPIASIGLHVPEGCGGTYGFVSSHAANTAGLAMLLWLLLRRRYPAVAWLFVWSGIVSYSRVYLGKHYPLDIVGGAAVGVLWGMLAYRFYLETAGRLGWLKPDDLRLKARGWG